MKKKVKDIIFSFPNNQKIGKKVNPVFFDEYTQKIFSGFDSTYEKNKFLISIKDYKKTNFYTKLLFKKVNKYRKEIGSQLNSIHKTNHSKEYWAIVLDSFLYFLTNSIVVEYNLINKYVKKSFFIENNKPFNGYYTDTDDFQSKLNTDNRQLILRSIIFDELKLTLSKKNNIKPLDTRINYHPKISFFKNLIKNIIIFFIRTYIKGIKPILLVDSYFGIKNSFLLFIKSYGKILILSSNLIFYEKKKNVNANIFLRKSLKIKQSDKIDKIFNSVIGSFLPASFLELYKTYNCNLKLAQKIKLLGTGIALNYDDRFKYLAANAKKNKGKLIHFQHGGIIGETKNQIEELIIKNIVDKEFFWKKKNKMSVDNYLSRFKKIDFNKNLKNNSQILLVLTRCLIRHNYSKLTLVRNHPFLRDSLKFHDHLNDDIKLKTKIKIFPYLETERKLMEKILVNRPGVKLLKEKTTKIMKHYASSRIIIIEEISTSFYELLKLEIPFIVMTNEFEVYNKKFTNDLLKLSNVNILFRDPLKAAKFVNSNYYQVNIWWNKVLKSRIYRNFKKRYIPEKLNYAEFKKNLYELNKLK